MMFSKVVISAPFEVGKGCSWPDSRFCCTLFNNISKSKDGYLLNILDIALRSKDWPPWSLANLLAHFMAIPRTDEQEVKYTF